MRKSATVSLTLITLALGGCLMGPDYMRPAVDSPSAWRVGEPTARDLANTVWWEQFDDPALDVLVTTALAENKDLLIASYLAGSLLEAEGPEGLDTGLGIVADLLQTYWDSLFPSLKRLRARRNAVQWLIDRISQKAAETSWPAQPVAGEVIDSIMRSLRAIDATLAEKDDEAPSMGPLLTLFDRLPRMEAETDAGAAPQTPPAAPSPSAGEPSPAPAALPSASPPSVAPPAATMRAPAMIQ